MFFSSLPIGVKIIRIVSQVVYHFLVLSVSYLVWEKLENVDQCSQKLKMTLINPNNQFTVIAEERNLKIFTFKKLESDSFDLKTTIKLIH